MGRYPPFRRWVDTLDLRMRGRRSTLHCPSGFLTGARRTRDSAPWSATRRPHSPAVPQANDAMNLTRHRSPASRAPSARAGYRETVRPEESQTSQTTAPCMSGTVAPGPRAAGGRDARSCFRSTPGCATIAHRKDAPITSAKQWTQVIRRRSWASRPGHKPANQSRI